MAIWLQDEETRSSTGLKADAGAGKQERRFKEKEYTSCCLLTKSYTGVRAPWPPLLNKQVIARKLTRYQLGQHSFSIQGREYCPGYRLHTCLYTGDNAASSVHTDMLCNVVRPSPTMYNWGQSNYILLPPEQPCLGQLQTRKGSEPLGPHYHD